MQLMQDQDKCTCQVNPMVTQDDFNDAALRFDTTKIDGSGVINVKRIRENCAPSDPVVVEEGQGVGEGLFVDKVDLVNLVPTGNPNEWRGKWRVTFQNAVERTAVPPVEVYQYFFVDPTSAAATPSSAIVERCKGKSVPGVVTACPPLMTIVGTPGQFGSFCIDQVQRAAAQYMNAKTICGNYREPGYGPSRLCDHNQWLAACLANTDPSFLDGWEWIADNDDGGSITLGGSPGNCSPNSSATLSTPMPYRCCVR